MNYYSALKIDPDHSQIESLLALYTRLTRLWMGLRRENGLEAKRLSNLIVSHWYNNQMFQTVQVSTEHLTQ